MKQELFVVEVLKVVSQYNPDLVNSTSYEEVLKDLTEMKDKALRMDIITSAFKPEPELFPVTNSILNKRPTLRETQERRQGQL